MTLGRAFSLWPQSYRLWSERAGSDSVQPLPRLTPLAEPFRLCSRAPQGPSGASVHSIWCKFHSYAVFKLFKLFFNATKDGIHSHMSYNRAYNFNSLVAISTDLRYVFNDWLTINVKNMNLKNKCIHQNTGHLCLSYIRD